MTGNPLAICGWPKVPVKAMKQVLLAILFFLLVLVLSRSCTNMRNPRGYPFPRNEKVWEKEIIRSQDERVYPFSELGVPKGHLPPPGECKVWFPGRPLSQQPPATSCASVLQNAPLGAWVITQEEGCYKVNIYNRTRRNVIDAVRYYETN
jgi:hypothetical protein